MENPLRTAVLSPRVTLCHWGIALWGWPLWLGDGSGMVVSSSWWFSIRPTRGPSSCSSVALPDWTYQHCVLLPHALQCKKCANSKLFEFGRSLAFFILCLISLSLDGERKWLLERVSYFFIYSCGSWCVYDYGTQWIAKKKEEGNQREKKQTTLPFSYPIPLLVRGEASYAGVRPGERGHVWSI